jgi:tetratricopeptide (TPR) repeat protein
MFAQWRFYLSFLIPPAIALVVLAARADVLKSWQGQVNTLLTSGGLRPWPYLLTESRVILRYLRLIAIPSGLNLDYDFPPAASITEPGVLLSILVIAGLVALAWTRRRTEPVFSFSIFWFFITLSVTSSILPIPDVITERRLYLPLAGVCLLFPLALEWLVKSATGAIHSRVVMRVAAVLLGVLMIGTIFRNNVWSDEVRLFSDTVAKSPHKLRPYENLILAHMKRGEEEQAITLAKAGIENVPSQRISLLDTLGTLYLRLGRPEDAVESFKRSNEEAVRAGAGSAFVETSFNNLGSAYLALAGKGGGQNPKTREEALRNARQAFQKSLEQVPGNVSALDGVVNATLGLGESGAMQQELRRRLEASPNEFSALYMLASLLSWEQHYPESIEYFRRAAAAQQTNSDMLYFNYAFALSKIGQIEPAIQGYKEALRQDPTFNEAHYNLALLYIQKGDYASAVEHLTDIVNAEAGNVRANMKLAEIYAYQQKLPLARRHLHQVLKANPQDREALSLFAKIGE